MNSRIVERIERVDRRRSLENLRRIAEAATAQTGSRLIGGALQLRRDTAPHGMHSALSQPKLVVILTGRKLLQFGDVTAEIDANQCFLCGLDMPVSGAVPDCSPQAPMLSAIYSLSRTILGELAAAMPPSSGQRSLLDPSPLGCQAEPVWAGLLDALLRFIEAADSDDAPVLLPMVHRELHLMLLKSAFGTRLAHFLAAESPGSRIAGAVRYLQAHYREPFEVADLARRFLMAPSTFHRHFKAATSVSPIQYQKRLRLEQARRMIEAGKTPLASSLYVGYESLSQFSREYKRLFGESPRATLATAKAERSVGVGAEGGEASNGFSSRFGGESA